MAKRLKLEKEKLERELPLKLQQFKLWQN